MKNITDTMNDEEKILRALRRLVGAPIASAKLAGDMLMFGCGGVTPIVTRRGAPGERADFGLHVSCPWRFIVDDDVIIGSGDIWLATTEREELVADLERARQHLTDYIAQRRGRVHVADVEVGRAGFVALTLSDGSRLELCPMGIHAREQWRLLITDRETGEDRHVVVNRRGIER